MSSRHSIRQQFQIRRSEKDAVETYGRVCYLVSSVFRTRAGILAYGGKNIKEKGQIPQNKEEVREKSTAGSKSATVIALPALPPGDMRLGGWFIYTWQDQVHSFSFSCLECSREDLLWIWVNDCYL